MRLQTLFLYSYMRANNAYKSLRNACFVCELLKEEINKRKRNIEDLKKHTKSYIFLLAKRLKNAMWSYGSYLDAGVAGSHCGNPRRASIRDN